MSFLNNHTRKMYLSFAALFIFLCVSVPNGIHAYRQREEEKRQFRVFDIYKKNDTLWKVETAIEPPLAEIDTNIGVIGPFRMPELDVISLKCLRAAIPGRPGNALKPAAWMAEWPALHAAVQEHTLKVNRLRLLDADSRNLYLQVSDTELPAAFTFSCADYPELASFVVEALDGERRLLDDRYQRNAPHLTLASLRHADTPVTFQARTNTGTYTGQGTFKNAVCDTLHTRLINTSVTLTGRLGQATQPLLDLTYDPATQAALKRLPARLTQRFRQDLKCPATPLQDIAAVITTPHA